MKKSFMRTLSAVLVVSTVALAPIESQALDGMDYDFSDGLYTLIGLSAVGSATIFAGGAYAARAGWRLLRRVGPQVGQQPLPTPPGVPRYFQSYPQRLVRTVRRPVIQDGIRWTSVRTNPSVSTLTSVRRSNETLGASASTANSANSAQ